MEARRLMVAPLTLIRIIDTETTGIDDPAEMVEVGWTDVRLFPDGWAIENGPRSRLVDPGMPITFPAMAVHHITQAEAEAETSLDPDGARILATSGVDIICAHNWQFDSRFIRTKLPAICTFKCARTIWPDLQGHSNGSIRYELGLVPHDDPRAQPSHRAGPDTWVTAHILLKLLEAHTVERLLEISANPVLLGTCYLKAHKGKRWSEVPDSYLDWIVNKSDMAKDPKSEDVVRTARYWLNKRAAAPVQAPGGRRSRCLAQGNGEVLMEVFIVMGNDFPDSVYATQELADAYCDRQRDEDARRRCEDRGLGLPPRSRVYWRVYPFDLKEAL
jgi:exodeoxyribonuclease X